MTTPLDDHGQPLEAGFNAARRATRTLNEMLGLVKGVIIDGVVTESEAEYLANWIAANPEAVDVWPGSVLSDRLHRIFADGLVDDDERQDLLYFLRRLAGEDHAGAENFNPATSLPLDQPPPELSFADWTYVFTGRFIFGTRTACQQAVRSRGGDCARTITKKTNALVIGDLGSRDWAHTSFGRKIEKAVAYRDAGVPLSIVGEDHWASFL